MQLRFGELNKSASSNCGVQLSLKLCCMGEPYQQSRKSAFGLPDSIISETHRVQNDSHQKIFQQDRFKKCDLNDVNPFTYRTLLNSGINPFSSRVKSLNESKTQKDKMEGWKESGPHILQYSSDTTKLSNNRILEKQQGMSSFEQETISHYTLRGRDRDRKSMPLDHQVVFSSTRCGERMRPRYEYFDQNIGLLQEENIQNKATVCGNDSVAPKGEKQFKENPYYLPKSTKANTNFRKDLPVENSLFDSSGVNQLFLSRSFNENHNTETQLGTQKEWEPIVETSGLDLDSHSDDTAVKKGCFYGRMENTFIPSVWGNHKAFTTIENHSKDETLTPLKVLSQKQILNDVRQSEYGETKSGRKLIKPSCITCRQLKKVMPVVLHYFENLSVSRKGICRMLKGCLYLNSPKPSPNFLLNTLLPLFLASTVLNFDWTVHSQSSLSYLRLWVCNQPRGKQLIQDFRVHYNAPTRKTSRRSLDVLHVSPQECYVQNLTTVKTMHPCFSFDSVSCVV